MANAIDGVKFAPDEAFDAKKMQTLTEATKEGLDLYRTEINQLTRDKTGMVDGGNVEFEDQVDISEVSDNTFVKWMQGGTRCIGVVLDGKLEVIKGIA